MKKAVALLLTVFLLLGQLGCINSKDLSHIPANTFASTASNSPWINSQPSNELEPGYNYGDPPYTDFQSKNQYLFKSEADTVLEATTGLWAIIHTNGDIEYYQISDELPQKGNRTVETISSGNGETYLLRYGRFLRYYNGQEIVPVSDRADEGFLSFDGSAIAYLEGNNLFLFSNGVSKQIAEDVDTLCCISPDGKAVGYLREISPEIKQGFYWAEREWDLGQNIEPFFLSNGGAYVYLRESRKDNIRGENFVQVGSNVSNRVKLCAEFHSSGGADILFNADGTEIIYTEQMRDEIDYTWTGDTFICVKGQEPVSMYDWVCGILTPYNLQFQLAVEREERKSLSYIQLGITTFANTYWGANPDQMDESFHLPKYEYDPNRRSYDGVCLVDNGRKLLLNDMNNNTGEEEFYIADSFEGIDTLEPALSCHCNPASIIPATDGKTIFCTVHTGKGETSYGLYVVNQEHQELVCDEVDEIYLSYDGLFQGKILYYISNGELYCSDGYEERKIEGLPGIVSHVLCTPYQVEVVVKVEDSSFLADEDGYISQLYVSTDGIHFSLVDLLSVGCYMYHCWYNPRILKGYDCLLLSVFNMY